MPEISELSRLLGIIDSMTPKEREDPSIINPSRRNRIATGAGVPANEVNDLVKRFDDMKQFMVGTASV